MSIIIIMTLILIALQKQLFLKSQGNGRSHRPNNWLLGG